MTVPPIILKRGFVEHPDPLFDHLVASVKWDERMRARKTASVGVSYDYSQMSYPAAVMLPKLDELCNSIERELGFLPNNCLLNFYPDGEASMGFHSDTSEDLVPETGVAIISLGGERPIVYRLKADKTVEAQFILESGSLLFMSDKMQEEWLHAIPRAPGSRPRISATFRCVQK